MNSKIYKDRTQEGASKDRTQEGASKDRTQEGASKDRTQEGASKDRTQEGASKDEPKPLTPLHKTLLFWLIISLTGILPLITANLIYPSKYWNLATLENWPELFKTSIVIGGACLSLLTIYSLAYRSHETTKQFHLSLKQFQLSSKQFEHSILNQELDKIEKIRDEIQSMHIFISRLEAQFENIKSIIEGYNAYIDSSGENTGKGYVEALIKENLNEQSKIIFNLSNDMHLSHKVALSRLPIELILDLDKCINSIVCHASILNHQSGTQLHALLSVFMESLGKYELAPLKESSNTLLEATNREFILYMQKIELNTTMSK